MVNGGISWPGSKECAQYFAQAHSKRRGQISPLNFDSSVTSVKDTPNEANKILGHKLSNFTLTIS